LPGDPEDISAYSAAADLRDSVARITKNNFLLQAEMERTRAELVAMADACKRAQQQSKTSEGTIDQLSVEVCWLKEAKQRAEQELEELKQRMKTAQASLMACATQTDEFGCAACGNEQQLRNKAQKDREEAYYEVRRMRHLIMEGQRQLAESESRCCEWQQQAEHQQEARQRAEKEREAIKAAAIQLNMKWEEAKRHMKRDAQHIAELRNRVSILEAQHAQMGNDLKQTRAHLKQLQVEMEVQDERATGRPSAATPSRVAQDRAHLQAEEILYRTYIEAEQASTWQLMLAEVMPVGFDRLSGSANRTPRPMPCFEKAIPATPGFGRPQGERLD
jgi:chromosome segregation ATPase